MSDTDKAPERIRRDEKWPLRAQVAVVGVTIGIVAAGIAFGYPSLFRGSPGEEDRHIHSLFGEIIALSDGNWTLRLDSGDPTDPAKIILMVYTPAFIIVLNTTLTNPVNFTFNDLTGDGKVGAGDTISLYRGYEMKGGNLVGLRVGKPVSFAMMKIRPYGLPNLGVCIHANADGTWTMYVQDYGPSQLGNISIWVFDPDNLNTTYKATLNDSDPAHFTFNDDNNDTLFSRGDSITLRYSEGCIQEGYWMQILYDGHGWRDAFSLERHFGPPG